MARTGPIPLAAVLATSLTVAFLTTSSSVAVPPSLAFLVVGGLVAVAALLAPERLLPLTAVVAAVAAGAAAGHLLASPGMPRVHDIGHLWGIWAYGRCVLEGSVYPLWIPYLGAGEPVLQFYGPVSFLLALPGVLAGLTPMGAFKLELFVSHVLASIAMLAGARLAGASWRGAGVAAVALAFAPWRLAVFGYRGALGEANAYLFLPLAAGALIRTMRAPSLLAGSVLALATVGLILTHVVSLLTLAVVLVPVPFLSSGLVWSRVRATALALVAAAGLTAFWWVPVIAESRYTSLRETTEDNPYYLYEEHGVAAASLLARQQWDRLRVSIPESQREARGLEGEQMPFYTGAVLVLSALSAAWWSGRREAWGPAAGCLLGLALATAPLAKIVGAAGVLAPVRFPWRFLSPAAVLACLAIGIAVAAWDRVVPGWKRAIPLAALVALLVWDATPYTGAADRIPEYRGVVHWHTDDPQWVSWERSMRQNEIDWSSVSGVARVRNLELPPSSYRTEIDSFFPGYYEWLTPTIYERYWKSMSLRVMGEAGVMLSFNNSRREPLPAPARAYATIERKDGTVAPLAAGAVRRRPGKIEVEVDVPEGGGRLVVLEQMFPGWLVSVDDDKPAPPADTRGFVSVDLAGGAHRVVFAYGNQTPARRAGRSVSLFAFLACAIVLTWRRRSSGP